MCCMPSPPAVTATQSLIGDRLGLKEYIMRFCHLQIQHRTSQPVASRQRPVSNVIGLRGHPAGGTRTAAKTVVLKSAPQMAGF